MLVYTCNNADLSWKTVELHAFKERCAWSYAVNLKLSEEDLWLGETANSPPTHTEGTGPTQANRCHTCAKTYDPWKYTHPHINETSVRAFFNPRCQVGNTNFLPIYLEPHGHEIHQPSSCTTSWLHLCIHTTNLSIAELLQRSYYLLCSFFFFFFNKAMPLIMATNSQNFSVIHWWYDSKSEDMKATRL